MTELTVTLHANTWKALAICAANRDVRYYMKGVALDFETAGRIFAVSTDGHRMLVYRIERDMNDPQRGVYIVPREAFERVKPASKGADVVLTIDTESQRWHTLSSPEQSGALVDGRYPEWRRVVVEKTSGEPAQFDPAYVGDFGRISKLLGSGLGYIHISYNGLGAALINFASNDAIGILMPHREEKAGGIPAGFLSAVSEAA